MVRLVCELVIRQCDCNGAAERTFCAAVILLCLGSYAMSAVRFLVLTLCVSFDCVLGLL